jgi:vacuolar-type H+-ATPase subunit I/STV1
MWTLIRLALLLVAGIVVYNYFFGTTEEREQSKTVINTAKEAGKAVWSFSKEAFGLLRKEKTKFDQGKYDEAVDNVGNLYDRLRGHAKTIDDNRDLLARLDRLERERTRLEEKIDEPSSFEGTERQRQTEIRQDWEELMRETEDLVQDMERRK